MTRRGLLLALLLLASCKEKPAPPPPAPPPVPAPVPAPPPKPPAPVVSGCVVMDFGDKTILRIGKVATEQMEAVVRATNKFPMVDREEFKSKQPGLEKGPMPDPLNPSKLAVIPGVDWLVLGSISKFQITAVKPAAGAAVQDLNNGRLQLTVGLDLKFVYSATGEVLARRSGDVVKEDTASAWRVRVLGIGGRNEILTDPDSRNRLLRMVLDEEFRKLLPAINGRLSSMGGPK